jgi:hypothetical protein
MSTAVFVRSGVIGAAAAAVIAGSAGFHPRMKLTVEVSDWFRSGV